MSSLETPVLRAAHAAENYWFEDGFENIYRGFLLLLLSVDFFLPAKDSYRSLYLTTIAPFLGLIGLVLFGILLFAHRTLIAWIKAKVTFPRVGYAAPPPSAVGIERHDTGFWPASLPTTREEEYIDRQQKIRIWSYAFIAMLLILGLSKTQEHLSNNLVALIWALFLGLASKYTQPPGRAAWTALLVCISMGILVVLLPNAGTRPAHKLFPCLGVLSTVTGIFQTATFLFRHPRSRQTGS